MKCPMAADRGDCLGKACAWWVQGDVSDPGMCAMRDMAGWMSHLVQLDKQRLEALQAAGAPPVGVTSGGATDAGDVGAAPTLRTVRIVETETAASEPAGKG